MMPPTLPACPIQSSASRACVSSTIASANQSSASFHRGHDSTFIASFTTESPVF
jgi:hypothetical protein